MKRPAPTIPEELSVDEESTRQYIQLFSYNGDYYIRGIPGKNLFKSTMVHEVVNRGDIFAIRIRDHLLTVIPGTATVEFTNVEWIQ